MIISGPYVSSEMDDTTAQELRRKAQIVATKVKDVIIRALGAVLSPTMDTVPDQNIRGCN